MPSLPIRVIAEVLPGKEDPASEARFANGQNASGYAVMLAARGHYSQVWLVDENGQRWPMQEG